MGIRPYGGSYGVAVGANDHIGPEGSGIDPPAGTQNMKRLRAINDRPYGGAGTNFGLPPRYPKNVRHSERNEVESKNLLRSEKE